LTEGQILSAPMILFGVYLLVRDAGHYPPASQNKGSQ